jgi:chromosome segregation ATPase
MTIEELIAKLAEIKKSDSKDALITQLENGLTVFQKTYAADIKTKGDTLDDLRGMKDEFAELKKAYGIEESVNFKDSLKAISDKKAEYEKQVSTLGASADDQTTSLADLQRRFGELEGKHDTLSTQHVTLQSELSDKATKLEEETFDGQLKESFGKVGEMSYFGNVQAELKKMIKESPDKKMDDICSEYVTGKPVFARDETNPGPGGELSPEGDGDKSKVYTMTDVMNDVTKGED